MNPSPKCYFVSDLHLLASRSNGHEYFDQILEKAGSAEAFVLGGDIFDFRWSRMNTVGHAVDAAAHWLADLASQCPSCQFHFLLGNHDYHAPFIERLVDLERDIPNFAWERFYIRLGNSVCLHGDVADRKMDAEELAERRERMLHKRKRGEVLNSLYELAINTNLHRPIPYVAYGRRLVARRISSYLRHIGQGPEQGVRNIYFGHTHIPLANYHYKGLTFHNSGASIRGVKFQILPVETAG